MSSIPLHAPPYPTLRPVLHPYTCRRLPSLTVTCETSERVIREVLAPTPFEYLTKRFLISILDFSDCQGFIPFKDVGVIIPVRYGDTTGGYYCYEYEDTEGSVIAGREWWGYPKKLAQIRISFGKERITASVRREGVRLIDVTCELLSEREVTRLGSKIPTIPLYPHLTMQVIPNAEGPGFFMKRIIARDTSIVSKVLVRKYGRAKISISRLASDPIYKMLPVKILGSVYTVSDYKATWAKVLATIPGDSPEAKVLQMAPA